MDENECTQFYYHAKTKEKVGGLKVFLCLLEEGGQCQMNVSIFYLNLKLLSVRFMNLCEPKTIEIGILATGSNSIANIKTKYSKSNKNG